MNKIGMFFGSETGTTRLVAKKIHKKLGEALCDKPVNVNRVTLADLLRYDALILGTPSYGEGDLPGKSVGCFEPNWEEFFAQGPAEADFSGKHIAFLAWARKSATPTALPARCGRWWINFAPGALRWWATGRWMATAMIIPPPRLMAAFWG